MSPRWLQPFTGIVPSTTTEPGAEPGNGFESVGLRTAAALVWGEFAAVKADVPHTEPTAPPDGDRTAFLGCAVCIFGFWAF